MSSDSVQIMDGFHFVSSRLRDGALGFEFMVTELIQVSKDCARSKSGHLSSFYLYAFTCNH